MRSVRSDKFDETNESFCSLRLLPDSGSAKELDVMVASFLCGLRLLHPLMPHLSEVLWQSLTKDSNSILMQDFPKVGNPEIA